MESQTIRCPHCGLTIVIEAGDEDDDEADEFEAASCDVGDEEL